MSLWEPFRVPMNSSEGLSLLLCQSVVASRCQHSLLHGKPWKAHQQNLLRTGGSSYILLCLEPMSRSRDTAKGTVMQPKSLFLEMTMMKSVRFHCAVRPLFDFASDIALTKLRSFCCNLFKKLVILFLSWFVFLKNSNLSHKNYLFLDSHEQLINISGLDPIHFTHIQPPTHRCFYFWVQNHIYL